MSFKRRLVDKFRLFSAMALLSLMIVACGSSGVHGQVNNGKITICHATGSTKNPFVLITVSVNGLNGHGGHPVTHAMLSPPPVAVVLNNRSMPQEAVFMSQ
jgi:hypothetical protein